MRTNADTSVCARAAWLLCGLVFAAGCSSKASEPANVGCPQGYDGCLGMTISNDDATPYAAPGEPDGKGTMYLALIDQCPSPQNQQFKFVSEIVSVEDADLTGGATYSPALRYRFNDSRFGTTYQAGDHVALGGFLDDNLSVTVPTAPLPNDGDTLLSCADIELAVGQNLLTQPVVPCMVLSAPPTLFRQDGFNRACDSYLAFLDAGAGGSGGADAAIDAAAD